MEIYLPKISTYYINLDEDVSKARNIEKLLKYLSFKDVKRVPGIKHDPKRVGIAKSFIKTLEAAIKQNKPFIVLEDDVSVYKFIDTITVPDDADAVYLGNSAFGLYNGIGRKKISVQHIDQDLFKLHNMLSAHAILYINMDYVRFLIQAIKFNLSIETNQDKARAETMKYWNIYGFRYPMFYQNGKHELVTKISLPGKTAVGPEGAFGPY